MSYTKHAWVTGETITAEKLNNIEDGVDDLNRQLSDVEENQIPELKNAISQLDGGTIGQFLVKASNTDYDYGWVTVPSANGVNF